MAQFPNAIFTPRTIENRTGIVYDETKTKVGYAEDQNLPNDEIVAIQEILGLNPEGDATTVGERLDDIGDKLDTDPTDLKLSVASKGGVFNGDFELGAGDTPITASGWIEDEKYGWYMARNATAVSAEFDTAVSKKGGKSLKISTTDATGRLIVKNYINSSPSVSEIYKYGIPVKASTTYKISFWQKTNNVVSSRLRIAEHSISGGAAIANSYSDEIAGSTDWTLRTVILTTNASSVFLGLWVYNDTAGNISDAWFDDITIEEISENTSFTGKIIEKIKGVLQAVTSVDNIDQSLDTGGAYANTYALTTGTNEGATHKQTFTPTKKYITQIGVWVVAKGTGYWYLYVHDASNNTKFAYAINSASLVEGAFNYFEVPNIWTSGDLHFHVYSNVADATLKTNTSDDLEDASFIQRYAKKTEEFNFVVNGIATKIKGDKDGLFGVWDLYNAKYKFIADTQNSLSAFYNTNEAYSYQFSTLSTAKSFSGAGDHLTYKVKTVLPVKHFRFRVYTNSWSVAGESVLLQYSTDRGATWNTAITHIYGGVVNEKSPWAETDLFNGQTEVWIRAAWAGGNYQLKIEIEANIDTSKIPQGLFYPLATNQFTETLKLPSSATRVYFRTNKFQNENGVIMPALEFTDASGNNIGYTPLKIDNSQETNPAVDIIIASTTNGQQSGTGSNDSTTGYILNDGEYMTLSTAVAELTVTFKVGQGTTTFGNITKNVLYLSSNGDSDDATQDPSHQANFILGVPQQGLVQSLASLKDDVQSFKKNAITVKTIDITVSAGNPTGTAEVPRDSIIIGCVPISNQDQFVDSVLISGTTITVTLAAAATADNKFRVIYI